MPSLHARPTQPPSADPASAGAPGRPADPQKHPVRVGPSRIDGLGAFAAQAIPARNVVGSVVHTSCSLESPGFVRQHFGNRLIMGEPDGSRSERLQDVPVSVTAVTSDSLRSLGINIELKNGD